MSSNILIVISYYAKRSKIYLESLLSQFSNIGYDVAIVINDDNMSKVEIINTNSYNFNYKIVCIKRPNIGMNIGAWNEGYNFFPNYEYYIFLQDECRVIQKNFTEKYISELTKENIGMIGESINIKWNHSWSKMNLSPLNYNIKLEKENKSIRRVDYYLDCFKKWKISEGKNAKHLRSLIWAFSNKTLKEINGFPIGYNKEECIAAEIAVSKKVEGIGLKISQVRDTPFYFIEHIEWAKDGVSKKK